ncbi:hypothetical protein NLI96_g10099 [Meripilus lineatus]|uniref:Uncharacterized protein n=1 Tax=Meripilus lineatus TaxID=2056292 RepID=A0AAD5UW00_9APHY|nr:hypothetical protein NLI96_g10099 [Physisporinus lineatus]
MTNIPSFRRERLSSDLDSTSFSGPSSSASSISSPTISPDSSSPLNSPVPAMASSGTGSLTMPPQTAPSGFPGGNGQSSTPDSSSSIFSTTGGPPLILVFLAAALLIGALLALLVLRRLYPQRGGLFVMRAEPGRTGKVKRFGEKPLLWDVYLDDHHHGDERVMKEKLGWQYVVPISARFISTEPPTPEGSAAQPSSNSPLSTLRSTTSTIRKFITFPRSRHNAPSSSPLIPLTETNMRAARSLRLTPKLPPAICSALNTFRSAGREIASLSRDSDASAPFSPFAFKAAGSSFGVDNFVRLYEVIRIGEGGKGAVEVPALEGGNESRRTSRMRSFFRRSGGGSS